MKCEMVEKCTLHHSSSIYISGRLAVRTSISLPHSVEQRRPRAQDAVCRICFSVLYIQRCRLAHLTMSFLCPCWMFPLCSIWSCCFFVYLQSFSLEYTAFRVKWNKNVCKSYWLLIVPSWIIHTPLPWLHCGTFYVSEIQSWAKMLMDNCPTLPKCWAREYFHGKYVFLWVPFAWSPLAFPKSSQEIPTHQAT